MGQKKLKGYPFLFRFLTKKPLLSCSCPYFVKITSIVWKTRCSHVIFFLKIFMRSPLFSCPYLVKTTSILETAPYTMAQRSEFYEKNNAPMPCPYIVKKLPFSKTRQFSHSSFYQQNVLYRKKSCNLMWFFKYLENPLVPIFGQR